MKQVFEYGNVEDEHRYNLSLWFSNIYVFDKTFHSTYHSPNKLGSEEFSEFEQYNEKGDVKCH